MSPGQPHLLEAGSEADGPIPAARGLPDIAFDLVGESCIPWAMVTTGLSRPALLMVSMMCRFFFHLDKILEFPSMVCFLYLAKETSLPSNHTYILYFLLNL